MTPDCRPVILSADGAGNCGIGDRRKLRRIILEDNCWIPSTLKLSTHSEKKRPQRMQPSVWKIQLLLLMHHFVDDGFAALVHRDDLVNRSVTRKCDVDDVVSRIERNFSR